MIQLQPVRYFVATAELGTVSAAARSLHVTQPALSRQIRQLEADLGMDLFERSGGRLTLSRAGRSLLPWARRLLDAAGALQHEADLIRQGRLERITFAAPSVSLTDIVSPFVASMGADDPVVDVVAADTTTVADMLSAGADLAIGTLLPPAPFTAVRLPPLPVWAYVTADHSWAKRQSLELDELITAPLIVLPDHFTAREALETALAHRGLALDHKIEAANGSVAQAMAAAGRGVAMVSDDPRFDLIPIAVHTDEAQLSVRLLVAWNDSGAGAPALEQLAQRISTWVRQRYGATNAPE